MNRELARFSMAILSLSLVACGSDGGSGGNDVATNNIPNGLYQGTITPDSGASSDAFAIITSEGEMLVSYSESVDSVEAIAATTTSSDFNGNVYSAGTGSITGAVAAPVTGSIILSSGNELTGTYVRGSIGGIFSFTQNENISNKTSDLSKLTGVWVDDVNVDPTGVATYVVQSDGSFEMTTTLGCNGTGNFQLIDPTKNEYDLTMSITGCDDAAGNYDGTAVVVDGSNPDDTITMFFYNDSRFGFFDLQK